MVAEGSLTVIVIPPHTFGGSLINYCEDILSGRCHVEDFNTFKQKLNSDEDDECAASKTLILNSRDCFLQGELLTVAAILLPSKPLNENEWKDWSEGYCSLRPCVDLVRPSEGDSAGNFTTRGTSSKKTSAFSSQLWEAQAFPVDVPDGIAYTRPQFQTPMRAQLYILSVPLTIYVATQLPACSLYMYRRRHTYGHVTAINPRFLDIPLRMEFTFMPEPDRIPRTDLGARGFCLTDLEALALMEAPSFAAVTSTTVPLQAALGAPTPILSSVLYSSALTGGLYFPALEAAPKDSNDDSSRISVTVETEATRNNRLLDLAVRAAKNDAAFTTSSPGGGLCVSGGYKRSMCSIPVTIYKPLNVWTTMVEDLLYVQIDNITDNISLVVETVHIRSTSSYVAGQLPITLAPAEQYSLIICLDDEIYNSPSAAAESSRENNRARDSTASNPTGGGGSVNSKPHAKRLLPLCVKWRLSCGSSSVWAQFGAECQSTPRMSLNISINTSPTLATVGDVMSVMLTVHNGKNCPVNITVFFPRDFRYHNNSDIHKEPGAAIDAMPPPMIPLRAHHVIGEISEGTSHTLHIELLVTRIGVHTMPPLMVVDTLTNNQFLSKGGTVVII